MLPFIGQRLRRYREGKPLVHVFTQTAGAWEVNDCLLRSKIRGHSSYRRSRTWPRRWNHKFVA